MDHHQATVTAMQEAVDRVEKVGTPPEFMEQMAKGDVEAATAVMRQAVVSAATDAIAPGTLKLDSRFVETVEVGQIRCPIAPNVQPKHIFRLLCPDGTEHVFAPDQPGRLFFVPGAM